MPHYTIDIINKFVKPLHFKKSQIVLNINKSMLNLATLLVLRETGFQEILPRVLIR